MSGVGVQHMYHVNRNVQGNGTRQTLSVGMERGEVGSHNTISVVAMCRVHRQGRLEGEHAALSTPLPDASTYTVPRPRPPQHVSALLL